MLLMRTTIGQTAQAARAIERRQKRMRRNYTERALRHYKTSLDRVGVERDFCIAMVFSPQLMVGCIGQACSRLGHRRIYACCLPTVLSKVLHLALQFCLNSAPDVLHSFARVPVHAL